jgi:hypothetical protein
MVIDSAVLFSAFVLSILAVMTESYSPDRDDIVFLQEHFCEQSLTGLGKTEEKRDVHPFGGSLKE